MDNHVDRKDGLAIMRTWAKNREATRHILFMPGTVLRLGNIQYVTNVSIKEIKEMMIQTRVRVVKGDRSFFDVPHVFV
jgi:hypothetical protein